MVSVLEQRRNRELSQQLERASMEVSVREAFLEKDKKNTGRRCPRLTKRQ